MIFLVDFFVFTQLNNSNSIQKILTLNKIKEKSKCALEKFFLGYKISLTSTNNFSIFYFDFIY